MPSQRARRLHSTARKCGDSSGFPASSARVVGDLALHRLAVRVAVLALRVAGHQGQRAGQHRFGARHAVFLVAVVPVGVVRFHAKALANGGQLLAFTGKPQEAAGLAR
jgi:hypothetical protein